MQDCLHAIAAAMRRGPWPRPPSGRPAFKRFVLVLGMLVAGAMGMSRAQAATPLPCDIYNSAGTPCVAAHSTTRALYANYAGPLYQVYRSSDGKTMDIGVLSAGGYANAAAQDQFCASTYCIINRIYDQSPQHNDLSIAPPGVQGPADHGAPAEALAVTAGGHPVYGIEFSGHMGYRNNSTRGVATEGKPESMYMVTSGIHANSGCCFDYGNAEVNNNDPGDGHMDALNFGTECFYGNQGRCYGNGPWVMADMENGLFESNIGYSTNPNYTGNTQPFVTAMLSNNGQNHFSLKSADATVANSLFTIFDGPTPANNINRPSQPSSDFGYTPMHQEGAIILGIGGDNSQTGIGSFFEGVMTAGVPSADYQAMVQNNIASVGYSTSPVGGTPGTLRPGSAISLRATTACCTSNYIRHQNGNVVTSTLSTASSVLDRSDATWIVRRGLANNSCVSFESRNYPGEFIRHSNSILYRQPYVGIELDANAANDATFCPTAGLNGQGSSFQSVNYPGKYIRHYASVGYIASNGGSNAWDNPTSWSDDVSWIVTAPLAN